MNNAFLILGGNLGERRKNLAEATALLAKAGATIKRTSSIYETEPWGSKDQPNYYNQVVEILTNEDAPELMQSVLNIEQKMGRVRAGKYGARTIDIDILFFNNEIINSDHLTVPHPRLHERRFVLEPMNEIAPELVHPVLNQSISEILAHTNDRSIVKRI